MHLAKMTTGLAAMALFTVTVPAQCDGATDAAAKSDKDIVETAQKAGAFKTLLTAAEAAGLVDTLKSKGPFTVFAPTDEAFAKLPEGTIPALLKDKKKLAAILTYHVVAGNVPAKKLAGKEWAKTVNGQSFRVKATKRGVWVDSAQVIKTDISCSNGMIHVIDSVILPRPDIVDTAAKAGSFKTLLTAAKAAGLVDALKGEGPFTVFAPSDEAFARLPDGTIPALLKDKKKLAAILKLHVIQGRVLSTDIPMAKKGVSVRPASLQGDKLDVVRTKKAVSVNGAKVVKADIVAGNGVIHVIDAVILPK